MNGGSLEQELSWLTLEKIEESLLRLSLAGVAKEITGAYYDYSGGVYRPTALALRFVGFLKDSEAMI